jgi:hypothetical protein
VSIDAAVRNRAGGSDRPELQGPEHPRRSELQQLPRLIKAGLALPFVVLTIEYLRYARRGWFFLDDFLFIDRYRNSLHLEELIHPEAFGRFLTTNAYWNFAWRLFGSDATFYFAINFAVIAGTTFLLGRLIATHYGPLAGVVAGLVYFALPNVIDGYTWISNSQHLVAHFFVVLFFVVYFYATRTRFTATTVVMLEVVLVAALLSNQLASALAIVPAVDLALQRDARRVRTRWVILGLALVTILASYLRTRTRYTGPYATDISMSTLFTNGRFYFGTTALFVAWLIAGLAGFAFAARKRDTLLACLFLGGVGFVAPFLILETQRYEHYISLGVTFFLVAVWVTASQFLTARSPRVLPVVALVVALALGAWGTARFTQELRAPVGGDQRYLVSQMRRIVENDSPDTYEYCFTSAHTKRFQLNSKTVRVPIEWWGLGFGTAFTRFVDATKSYVPASFSADCDRLVRIHGSTIRVIGSPQP